MYFDYLDRLLCDLRDEVATIVLYSHRISSEDVRRYIRDAEMALSKARSRLECARRKLELAGRTFAHAREVK